MGHIEGLDQLLIFYCIVYFHFWFFELAVDSELIIEFIVIELEYLVIYEIFPAQPLLFVDADHLS